jgi:ABC-type glycerol-3-phosphate transport system substrate-binding protein
MNEDGTLKEDALKEYLEQVNRIWQTQKDAIEETKKAYQMGDDWANSDRSGYTNIAGSITDLLVKVNTVAAGGLLSPEGLVYLDSAKKVDPDLDYRLLNGQSENCFYPRSIVGISAKASEKEAAEKFVKFLFEEESQRASNDEGLAVNSKVYEDMAYWKMGKSSGDTIGSIGTSYDTGDGNIKQFVMDEIIPEDEAIQNIMDLGKTLTVPAKSNQIIRSAVTESGEKYLNGETGLDDAVKEIMQEVNLYLSE